MESNKQTTLICSILAIDPTSFSYRVCSICERSLPDNSISVSSPLCKFCNAFNPAPSSSSKRLFRILISIATDSRVFTVICFDRAARVLFGCSADEFFDFVKLHPNSASSANEVLEGELFRMTLSKPKNGNAQHLRVVQVLPLKTGFRPAMEILRELYRARNNS